MSRSKEKTRTAYVYKTMDSPVGVLTLVGGADGLAAILWENDDPKRVRLNIAWEDRSFPVLVKTQRQLEEYFAGKRKTFTVPLDFSGTDFVSSGAGTGLRMDDESSSGCQSASADSGGRGGDRSDAM